MGKMIPQIYVVDDDPSVREAVGGLIRSAGMKVQTFASAQEVWDRTQSEAPNCMVLDVYLPGINGLELQDRLTKANISIPIIFLTGEGTIPMSVRAMKAGALEFLTKPVNDTALLDAIQTGIARRVENGGIALNFAREGKGRNVRPRNGEMQLCDMLQEHETDLTPSLPLRKINEIYSERHIVGGSATLKRALAQIDKVAPTNSTVLLRGETGTGKELLARAIHQRSGRSSQPFVAVNCAAIPQSLIASELFGHEKGAFTGALQRRVGRFESAQRGTIFLDEIGELPPETQVLLLRVLQEREFERVGGGELIRADVRVIAATHCDLEVAISEGTFRSDLFYRLNVFPIEISPLRERKEDLPVLVAFCVTQFASKNGKTITRIDKKSMEMLRSYHWPGNVRELQNVIERSVITCEGETLFVDEKWMASGIAPKNSPSQRFGDALSAHERELIESALSKSRGRISGPTGAAAKLDMPPSTLDAKILSLGIDKHRFKSPRQGAS